MQHWKQDDNCHIAQDGGREGDHMPDTVQLIEDDQAGGRQNHSI